MINPFLSAQINAAGLVLFDELGLPRPEDGSLHVMIEQPSHLEHGDYSTNIAMQLAKALRKPPLVIAELIRAQLVRQGMAGRLLSKIEVVPPGFINLFIDWEQWAKHPPVPDASRDAAEKVVVEHTSINPNKSAHIGHLRNSCIGDTLVRLLRRTGRRVEVHNYIDDLGNQLADTVVGLLHTPLHKEHVRFGDYCWDIYAAVNREYRVHPELQEQRTRVLHSLEEGSGNTAWIGMLAAERIVREHVEEMKPFGIDFDLLVWESNIVREGFWSSAFELLRRTPLFVKETEGKLAGCWVLKQPDADNADEDSAHSADKVLVRSNGILTYTAKDIAYHLWKFGLLDKDFRYKPFAEGLWTTHADGSGGLFGRADMVINVIDHRQQYPQAMVKQALEALGFGEQAAKLRHVSYGVVALSPGSAAELGIDTSDNKASYAMSGRQGIGIKVAELLDLMEAVVDNKRSKDKPFAVPQDERFGQDCAKPSIKTSTSAATDPTGISSRTIAAAAIRYYLLRFNLHTEVVFDLQQATEISGNSGVYLLYSYARAVSVINKAGQEPHSSPAVPEHFPEMEKAEYALLRHIANWPDTLAAAGKELAPHFVCSYAFDLATLFNNFYAACPILKADDERKKFRVWLTSVFKETLGDALQVLGLPTPSRM
ncbi:arginine--tRNA ligase [Paenibacillus piri]|uniref:Arginine--tRNA ligase n=1 Tax=Paenibacillus piri TaxID=2547395 RepID=A0A4R5KY50_9BACL|nr:arginine--tRNA ligase [Paenibacillus piri]TDG00146.1 arginine--tRNA ligase [Paenibacillus piri]